MNEERRIAQVPIGLELLAERMLPPGSIIRDIQFNFVRLTADLIVEHPGLEPVYPGAEPPVVSPLISTRSAVVEESISW
jgi:hypothetical protein